MSGLVGPFTLPGAKLQNIAGNRNDTVVDDFEAIMTPTARLSKGVMGRMQGSAMVMLEEGTGMCKHCSE